MNENKKQTLSNAVMLSPQRIAEIEAFDNAWANLRGNPKRALLIQQMIESGAIMKFGERRMKRNTIWAHFKYELIVIIVLAVAIIIRLVIK
jgi:hypothetical protein